MAIAAQGYRGRFAPSPTGPLHFGSLVAALGSYCDARAAGGQWLLRIEDVDTQRTRPGAEALILRTLERYGFEWDGPVMRQSERTDRYEAALAQLEAHGDVFPCMCTRRSLAAMPLGAGGEPVYPGTCRTRVIDGTEARARSTWRLRVDRGDTETISFVDRLQGPQSQHLARDVGDFALRRADGLFTYQLAVVVDDAEQEISHIVRGADLLASTARQIYLQQRLGLPTPAYLHLPVAVNAAREKLSKQTRAKPVPDHNPLPALVAAWRFLDQASPAVAVLGCVADFWAFAAAAWNPRALPQVPLRTAPMVSVPGPGPKLSAAL